MRSAASRVSSPLPALLTGAFALLGCSGNDLEGSVLEVLPDLSTYTVVEVAIDPGTALAVSYVRSNSSGGGADAGALGQDTLFKIAVNLGKVTLVPKQAADLTPDFSGAAKATCSRTVANDPRNAFAPVKTGEFTVNATPAATQPLSGSFRVTFGAGGDVGEGRTAFGTFTTKEVGTATGI